MDNVLYKDTPTRHRVRLNGRPRVVHERRDWDGVFAGFVVHRTAAEVKKIQDSYLPARVGVCGWFRVYEHYFVGA